MRDAAGEFDDFKPALDVALGVGDDLAVLCAEQLGQILHICLDQALVFKHHAGAALGVGGGPSGLCGEGGLHGALQRCGIAQTHFGLNGAGAGVEYGAFACGWGARATYNDMIDITHSPRPSQIIA